MEFPPLGVYFELYFVSFIISVFIISERQWIFNEKSQFATMALYALLGEIPIVAFFHIISVEVLAIASSEFGVSRGG